MYRKFMRILVLSAHCDDETIGVGAHIAAWRRAGHSVKILFLTDGTPRNRKFIAANWLGSARDYRHARRGEAHKAAEELGLAAGEIIFGRIRDQELAANLAAAWQILKELWLEWHPHWVLAPALQGGHPDHDACNCLNTALRGYVEQAGNAANRRFLEYSLYAREGNHICYLPALAGRKPRFHILPEDWARKRKAFRQYRSQAQTLKPFPLAPESVRTLPQYDYSKTPEQGYAWELWGWNMRPQKLPRQFHDFLARQAARP